MYFVHIIENLENVTHCSSPILPMKHFITKINALQYVSHLYHTNTFHFCVCSAQQPHSLSLNQINIHMKRVYILKSSSFIQNIRDNFFFGTVSYRLQNVPATQMQ